MTIEEFMDRFQIRKKKTVSDWINKGLIPGVTTDPAPAHSSYRSLHGLPTPAQGPSEKTPTPFIRAL